MATFFHTCIYKMTQLFSAIEKWRVHCNNTALLYVAGSAIIFHQKKMYNKSDCHISCCYCCCSFVVFFFPLMFMPRTAADDKRPTMQIKSILIQMLVLYGQQQQPITELICTQQQFVQNRNKKIWVNIAFYCNTFLLLHWRNTFIDINYQITVEWLF